MTTVLAERYYVTFDYLTFGYCHRNSVCCLYVVRRGLQLVHPTQGLELFCNIFAPHCSLSIWLDCKKNSAKIFANVLHRGFYIQGGYKNRDFRQISRVISETIQDMATVTMEDE